MGHLLISAAKSLTPVPIWCHRAPTAGFKWKLKTKRLKLLKYNSEFIYSENIATKVLQIYGDDTGSQRTGVDRFDMGNMNINSSQSLFIYHILKQPLLTKVLCKLYKIYTV